MDPDHFEIRFMREALALENFAVSFERFGAGWRPARGRNRHFGPRVLRRRAGV